MFLRVIRAIQNVWISIGTALLILVLIEGVGRLALRAWDRPGVDLAAIEQSRGDDFAQGSTWRADYRREFVASYQVAWHPYVYWRRRPFHGKYINVDDAGLRRTWNKTPSPSTDQVKVFMFGGSTMWGTGARDEFTIPSVVSKLLAQRLAHDLWVVNWGETGYVSTQAVIALTLELRRGNVPNIVVFYGGVNDTWAAFQMGVAGVPQNEANRVAEFNSRQRLNWREGFVEHLALYRLARWAGRLARPPSPEASPAVDAQRAGPLASSAVDVYLQNIAIVEALSKRFGFHLVIFWQPTLFSKKHLSAQEKKLHEHFERRFEGSAAFFDRVYRVFQERTAAERTENSYDLSGIFDQEEGTVFIDQFHTTEMGNAKIGEAMVRVIQGLIEK